MEVTFLGYLTILKTKNCHLKAIFVSGTLVVGLLNPTLFDKKNLFFPYKHEKKFPCYLAFIVGL